MTFTFAPDFVLKRKRKRSSRPIDPCLGFYPDLIESPPAIEVGRLASTSAAHALPSHSHVATALSVTDPKEAGDVTVPGLDSKTIRETTQAQLTVEEFLRRAASPTKRYTRHRARQRKKARGDHIPSDDTYLPPSHPTDDSDVGSEDSPIGQARKRRRRTVQWTSDELEGSDAGQPITERRRRTNAKKSQKLSTRLLLAGASTGVDLLGGALLPPSTTHTFTRKPIPLVPDNRLPSPPAPTTIGRRQYVDPRKAIPFHNVTSQFYAADGDRSVERREANARPVTAWKPVGDNLSCQRGGGRAGIVRKASQRLVVIPLVLAPTTTHDNAEPPRRTTIRPQQPYHVPPGPIPFVLAAPLSHKRGLPTSALNLRPCSATSVLRPSARSPMTDACDDFTSPRESSQSPLPAQSSRGPLIPSPLAEPVDDALPAVLVTSALIDSTPSPNAPSGHVPAPLARASSPDVSIQPTVQRSVQSGDGAAAGPSGPVHPSVTLKPMKSLGTLMDDFREIARSATQNSLVLDLKPRARYRPTRKSMRSSAAPTAALQQQPSLSSLRSSILPTGPSPSLRRLQDRIARKALEREMSGASTFDTDAYQYGTFSEQVQPSLPGTGSHRNAPFDVLSALQARGRNILHLPSSPLPGWSVLPPAASSTP
ncbi:hypothetical protein GY45DRAFT_1086339 [Cubamyces sp. BRFM 1775]|nr:hypothetical protein GY45DRAFT_1086339 [Cubamyces sp. BRFM 1775]